MIQRVRLRVEGRVQGVAFRMSTRSRAKELGLRGWVANRLDGSVEIVAEGETSWLTEFVGWCEKGPPLARVDRVNVDWQEATSEFSSFEIR